MDTQNNDSSPKTLSITLTGRRPIKIIEDNWPIIAEGKYKSHDGQVECQANRVTLLWLKVRQHQDGRTIIYGCDSHTSQWQCEPDHTWVGQAVADGIRQVAQSLGERSGDDHWRDIAAETIADLPAEDIT